ncbi:hypothetical protein QM007_05335 [Rothia sp. SD9660Na]|uniref:hypothetical protein n=1 Tax=Rothia sp. SD9660Na TaxID=3047030 RepID=UPI0024BB21C3|nr:hypothetical protein [Rothia sp. SD9660Na]WHS51383.1 hypothetical protein QM007_05335 [Rothia sp. SD9660Na]
MLPGNYNPGPAIEAKLRIYVNGTERPHLSATYGIDSTAGLPDAFIQGGTGITSRTGTVTWAPDSVIEANPFQPIGETRWTPHRGDTIIIESTVEGATYREFTGYIGETTYNLTRNTATSKITDGLGDFLAQKVTINHQGNIQGIFPAWQAYRALTAAGLGVLPPVSASTVLHANHQVYTSIAEVGSTTGRFMQGDSYGLHTMNLTHSPSTSTITGDVFAITRCAKAFDTTFRLKIDGTWYHLTFSRAANEYRLSKGGTRILTAPRDPADTDPLPIMALTIGTGHIRLWTSRKTSVKTEIQNSRTAFTRCETVNTPGISVRYLSDLAMQQQTIERLHHSPAAHHLIVSREEQQKQKGVRGFEAVEAKTVLQSFCEATMSALAMDEYGVPRLWAREVFLANPTTQNIKVSERVFAGSFTTGRDKTYGRVEVSYQDSYITSQGYANTQGTLAYQPDNRLEITLGEELQSIITVPAEQDWHGVDLNMRPVIDASDGEDNRAAFNRPVGSWWGICFEDPQYDGEMRWTGAGFEDISGKIEQIGQRAYKLTHLVTGGQPHWKYYLTSPTLGVDVIRAGNRGVPLPMIRCDFITTWVDSLVQSVGYGGSALTFSHDASWWLTKAEAQLLARTLAEEMRTERVTFDMLPILWDPRIQLFDKLTITGQDHDGNDTWEVEALVTGKDIEWDGGVPSMKINVAALELTDLRSGKSYRTLGSVYSAYRDVPSTKTYGQVYDALPGKA